MVGAPNRRRPRRLSQLFAQLSHDAKGPVSIAQIRDALGNRSFAPLLVLFAAFNLLPLPPGTSAILGCRCSSSRRRWSMAASSAWLPAFVRTDRSARTVPLGHGTHHPEADQDRADDPPALLAVLAQAAATASSASSR